MSGPPSTRRLRWAYLGRVAYGPTVVLQESLRRSVKDRTGDEHLLLLEHEPVFTIGKNASEDDVVADPAWRAEHGVEIHRTSRGGKVTYHGPGQLVGYPILDLDPDRRDVRRYVHDLQEVLIRTLDDLGLQAWRREGPDHVGVWVGTPALPRKIASIGVHLSRWVTMHGFALNVATDLAAFGGIVACGLPHVHMTSVAEETGQSVSVASVAERVAGHLGEVFGRHLMPAKSLEDSMPNG